MGKLVLKLIACERTFLQSDCIVAIKVCFNGATFYFSFNVAQTVFVCNEGYLGVYSDFIYIH